jgi:hypothetical protein
MMPIPAAISFRFRSLAEFWDAWAHWLNPHYRQSMDAVPGLKARLDECRTFVDELLR